VKNHWLLTALFAAVLALLLQFTRVTPVWAATKPEPTSSSTQIAFSNPGNIYENKPFVLSGVLREQSGAGIANIHIDIYIDGNYLQQAPTNSNGIFSLTVNKQFSVGSHLVTAIFKGSRLFASTSASFYIQILIGTTLTVLEPDGVQLGDDFFLSGSLVDQSSGLGISSQNVAIQINGVRIGQTSTDTHGLFTLKVTKPLDAGTYLVSASFNGAHQAAPANGSTLLTILPSTVKVQTVPPLAGITFQMDNRQFVTGADGSASITVGKIGIYRLNVLLDQYSNPAKKVEFGRWTEESYLPFREVEVPTTELIQVGLNVFHRVSLDFVDLDGFPVDPSRISAITIKSAQGDVFVLKNGQPVWLPASRTARRITGLEETDLLYSVISVMVDGSNVVNSAQQRFFALPDDTWSISLLLYSLNVSASDGLFGSPVARSVDVQFPDGQVKNYPFGASGNMAIHGLARGIYRIELVGVNGLKSIIPVALSRNQEVAVKVITYLDLALVSIIGLGLALGLIIYGRPWLLRYLFARRRAATDKAGWSSLHEN
jgi:hypothetical protein